VAVPVGALRTEESLGVGEFPDLVEFGHLCREMGIGLIQLLPVNDTGYESSPYSALTAFALHPLYLRIALLPEAGSAFTEKMHAMRREFEACSRFPYYHVLRAKMNLLWEIYTAHEAGIAASAKDGPLAAWIAENPWVREYAVFRSLKEANEERSWKDWTSERQPQSAGIDALWDKHLKKNLFWVWIQQALDSQFREAAERLAGEGILLEGDLPILMNEDSCDVWAHGVYFHQELSAGAPPDMYSPKGQNWGFPIYNWEAQAKDDYAWWHKRLAAAEKYYDAYRIDHVLGFFRIWASPRRDESALLGRYIPYTPVTKKDLELLGFDEGRIRWVSKPHIPTAEVWKSLGENVDAGSLDHEARRVFELALDRIGSEELWLFKDSIGGEKDIRALSIHPAAMEYLLDAWADRIFIEYEGGCFSPVWFFRDSRAYDTLSGEEQEKLEALLEKKREESEQIWEKQGERLLGTLTESSSMLPCAEDLGEVPVCVPKVLSKLRILGLRVVRWTRDWNQEGQPYVPFNEYPELSVCTPAVHDSSTLRKWWDKEADQEVFSGFLGFPSLPRVYNPGTAKAVLRKIAAAASRFRVFQIQDLLHLSNHWYAPDSATERINVPGTANDFNWTYRLPASIRELAADQELVRAVQDLTGIEPLPGTKPKR
jgi:4-alpha-glucanotransferase